MQSEYLRSVMDRGEFEEYLASMEKRHEMETD
jgi:hypothetical protein